MKRYVATDHALAQRSYEKEKGVDHSHRFLDDLFVSWPLLAERIRRYPPRDDEVVVSELGNIIRAAEIEAGARYGLAAGIVFSRLEPLLPERSASTLAAHFDDLQFAERLAAALFVSTIPSFLLLARYGIWLLVPVGVALLAWASYRNAVAAAVRWGESLSVIFDLHRFLLYDALRLIPPIHRRRAGTRWGAEQSAGRRSDG
jgi:hypothetical protein